jgi:hypothetical protein
MMTVKLCIALEEFAGLLSTEELHVKNYRSAMTMNNKMHWLKAIEGEDD